LHARAGACRADVLPAVRRQSSAAPDAVPPVPTPAPAPCPRNLPTARRPSSPPCPRSTPPTSTCSAATSRPQRLRDADRQLPAAAGRLRRPELLRAGPERAVRDPHRQQRRRARGPHLPVPLQNTLAGNGGSGAPCHRRQERGHPADPGRHGGQRERRRAATCRDLQRDVCAATAARAGPAGDQRRQRRHKSSTSRWTTSA
jgi:hypothetical protein